MGLTIRLTREAHVLPRAVAPGVEVFAVGDIHGRSDLLAALLDEAARTPREAERREIVFLGDIIDRGFDNLGAIELALTAGPAVGADSVTRLMGNHEGMMRLALDPATPRVDARDALAHWSANGGARVIDEILGPDWERFDLDGLAKRLRAEAPARVMAWLSELQPHARSGGLLFVHAGLNPSFEVEAFLRTPWNAPLAGFSGDAHWAWVRRPFLAHRPGPEGWAGAFVVHGHTPNDGELTRSHAEQVQRFRLNLDGGSAMTGVTKMAIFRGSLAEVVSVRAG